MPKFASLCVQRERESEWDEKWKAFHYSFLYTFQIYTTTEPCIRITTEKF